MTVAHSSEDSQTLERQELRASLRQVESAYHEMESETDLDVCP